MLEALRTFIATHYHFKSVRAATEEGADIVPSRTVIREWEQPRRVADSQRGPLLRFAIEQLERLIEAYRNHDLPRNGFEGRLQRGETLRLLFI